MILFLINHYNNSEELLEFCSHVAKLGNFNLVITDNSRNFPEIELEDSIYLFKPNRNLGYLNGCAFGLKKFCALGNTLPNYICVSNTDIKFESNLEEFFVNFNGPSNLGCLAPQIILPSGKRQNPNLTSRLSKKRIKFLRRIHYFPFIGSIYLLLAEYKSRLAKQPKKSLSTDYIYSAHGSCFFLTKKFFEQGGDLDFGSFIYEEELHISEQILKMGLKILYIPQIVISHFPHSTLGLEGFRRRSQFHKQSLHWIDKQYY